MAIKSYLFFLCLLLAGAMAHGQLDGGRGDGFAAGQLAAQQLNGSVVSVSVLYHGSSGDGYASDLGSSFTLQGSIFNYSGGRGDGFAANQAIALLSGMSVSVLYAGGVADGFATDLTTLLLSGMTVSALYSGGVADGFAADQATALLSGINASALYAGGIGDGFSALSASTVLSGSLTGIYDGGVGDGHATLFITDLLSGGGSLAAIFGGGIGDGASTILSGTRLLNGTLLEAVLPVEWLSFEVRVDGPIVLLTWSTATELNSDYFEVERSRDGLVFRKIDELAGAGNSNTIKQYMSTDTRPTPGINYYRVKQVDYDAAFDYSETKLILFEQDQRPKLTVYPNPITDRAVNINLTGMSLEDKITVRIYNLNGGLMKAKEIAPIAHLELPSNWPAGQYSMVIQAGNLYLGRKLIIADR